MLAPTALLVIAFAVYRTARVLTHDTITADLRRRLFHWSYEEKPGKEPEARSTFRSYAFTFFTCPYCIGLWISAACYVLWVNASWSHPAMYVLGAAGGQTFLQSRGDADG